jgi:hypothetical protein
MGDGASEELNRRMSAGGLRGRTLGGMSALNESQESGWT